MTTVQSRQDTKLMAHLLRRAGFGATPDELDRAISMGYEATLDELLSPTGTDELPNDLIRRYHVDQSDLRSPVAASALWVYRMVKTESPLREKMCLLWHRLFATGATKLIQARVVTSQIDMFRQHGMGKFDNLLIELSRDPAMIMWLDNQDNHAASINENYGREILELFSMGVGNYTEDDIKECARAFTGWSVVNPDYMSIKMRNNTARPYGYISWQFEYNDHDHDHGEKTSAGRDGRLQRRGRRRDHLQAGGHRPLHSPPPVPLLRGRRAAGAAVAAHAASRPGGHRRAGTGLLRLGLQRRGHAAGAVHVGLLQGRGVPIRKDKEPRGDGGGHAAPRRRRRAAVPGHVRRLRRLLQHGPGSAGASQRGGLAGRQRVDKHRRLHAKGQLRQQDAERPEAGPA